MADSPFVWGQGGVRMTPDDIAAQRKIAQALMLQGADYSPVQSPWQGAARMAQGLLGGYQSGQADRASAQNGAESTLLRNEALGVTSPLSITPTAMPSAPSPVEGDNAAIIRAGLIQRGLPEHVADGFLMNFRDESGLNPGINEAAPIVPGSRGGFGLAQWTGPRRIGLEQFAAAGGKPVSDINTQLDYLSSELRGAEAPAAQTIMATKTPGDAAAAIARSFLRPAPENLERRVAQYLGGANDPGAIPANAQPTQSAAAGQQPAARSAINPAILKLVSSPYVSDADKKIGMMLLQNNIEQQTKANDPLRQLQIQEAQGKIQAMPLELRGKDLANTKLERDLQGEGAQPLSREERASFGIPEGQPAYKTRSGEIKFGPAGTKLNVNTGNIPAGYEQFTDPESGAIRMRQIPGGPKDTSKTEAAKADAKAVSTDVVTNAAGLARQAMSGATLPTTGTVGTLLSGLGETGAAELRRQINVLTANAKVENLNAMRAASPTGGALGAVSDSENAMMAAKSGALDPAAPKPQFERALEDYERTLLRVVHGKDQGDAINEQTLKPNTPATAQIQQGMTATNPQSGQKIIYRNGRWVPFS